MHPHATPAEVFAASGVVMAVALPTPFRFPLPDFYRPLCKQRLRTP
jgi:hypothetical protein